MILAILLLLTAYLGFRAVGLLVKPKSHFASSRAQLVAWIAAAAILMIVLTVFTAVFRSDTVATAPVQQRPADASEIERARSQNRALFERAEKRKR